jgi:carbamoyl-phosphate synthase large subunit
VTLLPVAKLLAERGFTIYATAGTHKFFAETGLDSTLLHWPDSQQQPNVLDYLRNKEIEMVINIPKNLTKGELDNDYKIRRTAVDFSIPLLTNARLASLLMRSAS